MGEIQYLLSPIPSRAKESGKNSKERGIDRGGTKYLRFNVNPPEDHHELINHINTIFQGIQIYSHKLEGMAQFNVVLTRSNTAVMALLAQMNVIMNAIQAQLHSLAAEPKNQTSLKRKYYCWSCGRNYTHGSKTCSSNKSGHQDEPY